MPVQNFLIRVGQFFLIIVVAISCKVATPPALPVAQRVPETFIGDSDTITDATILWRDFFSDPFLTGLIDTALKNNFDLLQAIQRVEMARASYTIRQNAFFPSLSVVASANVGNVNQNMVGNADQSQRINNIRDEYFVGLQSSWEADAWGKLRNQKNASYARLLATEKGKHLVSTTVVAEIARLYYELLAVDKELEVVRKNINLQETILEIIGIQKIGGRATELAVQQSKAQVLNTKGLEKEKMQRIVELETQINFIMGRFPKPVLRKEDINGITLPPIVREGVPSALLINRPDIQQAEFELVAAKADLQAARAAFLPSISISPYAGFNAITASAIFQSPESLAAGLLGSITAPLFNRKIIRSEFNRSVALRSESYYRYQQSIIRGYGEVVNTLRGIENLRAVYVLKEQEVEVLLNSVSTSRVLFTSGYATYLEVITAQESVLKAEIELASIKKEIFHSMIGLYQALGGGWRSN